MRHLYRRRASSARFLDTIHSDTEPAYKFVASRTDVAVSVAGVSSAIVVNAGRVPELQARISRIFYPIPFPADISDRSHTSGPLRIVYSAVLQQRWKRVLDLPVLVKALVATKVPFTLDIFGDGPDREKLEAEFANVEHAQAHVKLHGWTNNCALMAALGSYDAFLLLSDTEGQSIAMMEAMANALVPIVTDLTGAREVITDGNEGFLLPVGDIAGFANRIAQLAADREKLQAMGTAARARIAQTHAEPVAVAHFAEFLDRVSRLPLPNPESLKWPPYPECRMDRWHVPQLIQGVVRWKRGQWLD
jgi:glycosyltransferase involved in cell wall biosynthesis